MKLTTRIHDRDASGMTYVYPVVSRRAGGVSVGINLNPNNACNWRCIYCQVPGLTSGKGPPIDLQLLREELRTMLTALVEGDYMERHVPESARRLNDIAFSGNGEPTSSPQFREAVETCTRVTAELGLGDLRSILITNGSLTHQADVQAGLRTLAARRGEIWFKLDSATAAGQQAANSNQAGVARTESNLRVAAGLCPTWIQTMMLARDGVEPSEEELASYLELLGTLVADGVPLAGVLLYGLARRSLQPEALALGPLPRAWMEALAERIRALGLEVRLSL